MTAYKRVLLKLSGEALMGEDSYGINRQTIERMVAEVAEVSASGVELAVVIGGGNIFRGIAPGAAGMDRATADYMGPGFNRRLTLSRLLSPTFDPKRSDTLKKAKS